MKLYLSSYRLGNNPQTLVNLVGKNKKAGVIANSMDFLTDQKIREESVQREIEDLNHLGFSSEEVDLRKYFEKSEELTSKLREYGLIWARGGNVFILRRAYKESGMDNWLKEQRLNKELVYAGYSAGVCVLSPFLKGLELVDNPKNIPEGYKPEIIWEGIGLIDFAVTPHYMSNHPESESINMVVDYYIKNGVEYKTLRDGEVIIKEI